MIDKEIISAIIAVTVNMGGFTFAQEKRDRRDDNRDDQKAGQRDHQARRQPQRQPS